MNPSIYTDDGFTGLGAPLQILTSVLKAISSGMSSEAIVHFDDHFIFRDQALDLDFADKDRLIAFFRKSRELFPDTVLDVIATFECGDHLIAEWKVSASETIPYGQLTLQLPIVFPGVSVVRIRDGRIVSWSDYYNQVTSRRSSLAAFFTEWVEY